MKQNPIILVLLCHLTIICVCHHDLSPKTHPPPLCFASFCAESGTKLRTYAKVPLAANETVDIPLILINGLKTGPHLTIFAGVHGGEFIGLLALSRLARLVDTTKLRGELVLCQAANPPAVFHGRVSESPLDGVNLNRVFPGKLGGKPTEKLAAWLFDNLVNGSDAFVDLHSGSIDKRLHEYAGYRRSASSEAEAQSRALAFSLGMRLVIRGDQNDDGNSHSAAARMGIPAILIEGGELGSRDESAGDCVAHRLMHALAHLKMIDAEGIGPGPKGCEMANKPREFVWVGFAKSDVTGFWFPEFKNMDNVLLHQRIGLILDPASGSTLSEVKAPASGTVIYSMNALTVTVGTDLVAIASNDDKMSTMRAYKCIMMILILITMFCDYL